MLQSVAFIPDGNRRYAEKANVSLEQAYIKGFGKAEEILRICQEIYGLKHIVFYGLSSENLEREGLQLKILFALYKQYLKKLANSDEVRQNGLRVKVVGDKEKLKDLEKEIKLVEEKTKDNSNKTLYLALAYSSQKEIFDAAKKSNTEEDILVNLDIPVSIDLIIRTSGRQRLSNFLLWQGAYSEFYFADHMWPEFTKEDFEKAVAFFENTKRNLGK